jgi:hypothetical protein
VTNELLSKGNVDAAVSRRPRWGGGDSEVCELGSVGGSTGDSKVDEELVLECVIEGGYAELESVREC